MRKLRRLNLALKVGWGMLLLVPAELTASAQRPEVQPIVTHGQIAGAIAGIAGAGALIGIFGYVAINHNHSLTGCVRFGQDGIQLTRESDKQTFALIGDVTGIRPGDRVRVSGKKEKLAAKPEFRVQKVSRDFGPCEVGSGSR